jgi:hypothetical protein
MADHTQQQHGQAPEQVIHCYRCGQKYLRENEGKTVANALLDGWKKNPFDGKLLCKDCCYPRHPYDAPYFQNDERNGETGWYMDVSNSNHTVTVYKLSFTDCRPVWIMIKTEWRG